MSKSRDPMDDALDDALASYGEAPQKGGLEQRILRQVNERTLRARQIERFAAVTGAAAAAAICLIWWVAPRVAVQTKTAEKALVVVRQPEFMREQEIPVRSANIVQATAARQRIRRRVQPKPELAQFPTPSAFTSEERALLQLAWFRAAQTMPEINYLDRPVTPLQLAAVEIKPIE